MLSIKRIVLGPYKSQYDLNSFNDIRNTSRKDDVDNSDDLLYDDSQVTISAFMLLIALFVKKNNLSGDAVQQLLNLFSY